jgi:hypothetical protein|tara:strand:- start:24 stop:188 length:165 start_codon:yes stop_codon:yes gene_type:complete
LIRQGNELKAYLVSSLKKLGRNSSPGKNWEGSLGNLIGLAAKNVGGNLSWQKEK